MEINLLVLADSLDKENYSVAQETILPFLEHFGIPYREIDLAKEKEEINFNASGVLIAQEGLGETIPRKIKQSLYQAVKKGTGLINLDYHLNFWKELYQPLKIEKVEKEDKTSFIRTGETHYINQLQQSAIEKELLHPLEYLKVKTNSKPLLLAEDNSPLLLCSSSPRLVQFLISPKLWLAEYFGHCAGLDDILFRSIIWAVKKPFVAKMMPPFVTCRIDDANSSANIFGKREDSANKNFAYVDILNKYGYIPNIGLFIDDITEEDGKIIKKKYDKKLADFSPHAFKEDKIGENNLIYMRRTHNKNGPKLVEYSPDQLDRSFIKLDRQFANWGIKPSETVNSHYENPGVNALPFLKERGQRFMMFGSRFGKHYSDPEAYNWSPKPYGHPGFTFDYMPNYPDFFNVEAHPYKVSPEGKITDADIDFLWGNTVFNNENSFNDLETSAQKAVRGIKLGLDSGFFGCLMAHEQRIAALSISEWEEILKNIDRLTSGYKKIFKSYDYIAEYAKSKYDTKITKANYGSLGKITLKLTGKSTLPLKIYLFSDESCEYEFKKIPEFEGEKEVILE